MATVAGGPTVADWIAAVGQAVGAIGTFVAVGVALWVALGDRADRRAAQARLVSVRVLDGDRRIGVWNRSEASIFDVELLDGAGGVHRPAARDAADTPPPWAEIPPGASRDVDADGMAPVATFTDRNGLRWRRHGTSTPVRAPRSG